LQERRIEDEERGKERVKEGVQCGWMLVGKAQADRVW
jgi:hypothetical protein